MSHLPVITAEQVQNEVRKIAAEFPDTVYADVANRGCTYAPDEHNAHGCIVGFAIRRLGASIDENTGFNLGEGIRSEWYRHEFLGEIFTDTLSRSMDWLEQVQDAQDGGITWAMAVADADMTS